jgi:uncharacterized protein
MKTTIDLSDALFYEAKARAASTGQTLRALVEKGLRLALKQDAQLVVPYVWRDCSVGGQGLQSGQKDLDWAAVREMAYDDERKAHLWASNAVAPEAPQTLVYAHRRDSPFHAGANASLSRLVNGGEPWGVPWACVHEFFSVVTHPKVYKPASTTAQAIDQIDTWLSLPGVQLLTESTAYWDSLRSLLVMGAVQGPMVHDARIAAICLQHGVHEFWTADRDFRRFPRLHCRNPLLEV